MTQWDMEADVVVVGSGAAGMTAAFTAANDGLDVILLEKTDVLGGTTAYSGAGIWLPGNHVVVEAGVPDSVELGLTYLHSLVGDRTPIELQRTYVETGPELVRYLTDSSPWLEFIHTPFPDYFPGEGRFDLGRGLFPKPVRRDELGDDLVSQVRGTVSVETFGLTEGFPEDELGGGRALIARYVKALASLPNVTVMTEAPAVDLIEEGDRIAGVRAHHQGNELHVRARRGVVLAAGGFESNAEARASRQDFPVAEWTAGPIGVNTGEMIDCAVKVGAAVDLLDEAWWIASVLFPNGRAAFNVGIKDGIFVGPDGKRFANELQPYDRIGHEIKAYYDAHGGRVPIWWILDARHQVPPTFMLPVPDEAEFRKAGLWVSAETPELLAEQIGVPADALRETFDRYNTDAASGTDTEFHRAEDPYDLFFVRFEKERALHPLDQAPLYAIPIVLGDLGTKGGVKIDGEARVLRESGEPIGGLYAAGNTVANVTGAIYPGPGAPIGTGMVWGYRAAKDMLRLNA